VSNRELEFRFKAGRMAESSFHRDSLPHSLTVTTVSLDDHASAKGIARVDVIKATVNGHELEVLKGAVRLLPTVRNVVFQSARHAEVLEFLASHGFAVKKSYDVGARSEMAILVERTGR